MTFKIGITSDLLNAEGEPAFGRRALAVLDQPGIAWEWVPERFDVVPPDVAARYDGLYINLPRVTVESVGRQDCRLQVIGRNGVGFDAVDLAACSAKGIVVTNTPIAVRRPVAVATLTLIFALAGRLIEKNDLVHQNRWNDRNDYMGQGLTTRTLGLVGAGGIGQEIMRLARPFFGRMLAADPFAEAGTVAALGGELVALDRLVREADYVVVCCVLDEATRGLIGDACFEAMKPTAYFINVARGPIVDEAALIRALRLRKIAGAGLDVTTSEPIEPGNPLLGFPNVIITPHALCWTDECFHDIAATGLQSIVDVAQGRRPKHVVNPAALAATKVKLA
jgi:D-3-phosphoglycerate dehydrogenase